MIKSILIKNILSHKKSKVNFSPGVNMFIGLTGAGKSAIFQSLNWVINLSPVGDDHRSWWGGKMLSKMKLDTGETITLSRDKQNTYTLKRDKHATETFKAFGRSIPENIKRIINIDAKVNIQKQLERGVPIFLISESPGDVAKFFNKVAGLDKIDSVLKTAKASVKETDKEVESLKKNIKEKKQELAIYKGIDTLHAKILKAEKSQDLLRNKQEKIETIETLLSKIKDNKKQNKELKEKLKIKGKINDAITRSRSIVEWNETKKEIECLSEDIHYCETGIERGKNRQDTVHKINMGLSIISAIKSMKESSNDVNGLLKRINTEKKMINQSTKRIKKMKKDFPDICPLCGNKL